MPFKINDGYYFEAVQFVRDTERDLRENRLALCPTCAAKYRHALGTSDNDLCEDLLTQSVRTQGSIAVSVILAGQPGSDPLRREARNRPSSGSRLNVGKRPLKERVWRARAPRKAGTHTGKHLPGQHRLRYGLSWQRLGRRNRWRRIALAGRLQPGACGACRAARTPPADRAGPCRSGAGRFCPHHLAMITERAAPCPAEEGINGSIRAQTVSVEAAQRDITPPSLSTPRTFRRNALARRQGVEPDLCGVGTQSVRMLRHSCRVNLALGQFLQFEFDSLSIGHCYGKLRRLVAPTVQDNYLISGSSVYPVTGLETGGVELSPSAIGDYLAAALVRWEAGGSCEHDGVEDVGFRRLQCALAGIRRKTFRICGRGKAPQCYSSGWR